MATHDYVIANGTGAAVRSDLNGALAAIVSQNSSATEPSPSYAYQRWADTTAGVMKMRNGANNAWITLYQLDGEWSTIAFENGTAAAPSIYFKDSGTDTGIYSPGADQVGISTGGTVRLTATTTGITSALPVDVPLGAVGTPSITFTGDLNTGIYSPGADQVAISTGGTSRLAVSTTAVSSTLAVDVPLGAVGTPSITFTGDLNTGIWSPTADTIAFSEGGAEAMRIDSSSRLLVGTISANANGGILQLSGGITFPATAVAASDPNTLDDYEEGTWTPTDASGASLSLTVASAAYTRIGRLVTCQAEFTYPTTTNVSAAIIGGLPFTASALGGGFSMYTTIAIGSIALRNATNTSTILLTYGNNQDTSLANIDMSAAASQITFTYQVGA